MKIMSEKTIVAIHQPNFFPWLGFFDKIARADIFILLDHVQMPKTGGTWTNRVKLLFSDNEARWITVPIKRSYHGFQKINEIHINHSIPWQKKILKTLWANYSRTTYYSQIKAYLEPLIFNDTNNLADFNISTIMDIVRNLGLPPRIIRSSKFNVQNTSNEMLIALVKAVGGTTYLCGGGSSVYIDENKFLKADIELIFQNFKHPIYPQIHGQTFTPGLSIIDVLMNCGLDGTKSLLLKRDSLPKFGDIK